MEGVWLSGFGKGRIVPGKDGVEERELAQGLKKWGKGGGQDKS